MNTSQRRRLNATRSLRQQIEANPLEQQVMRQRASQPRQSPRPSQSIRDNFIGQMAGMGLSEYTQNQMAGFRSPYNQDTGNGIVRRGNVYNVVGTPNAGPAGGGGYSPSIQQSTRPMPKVGYNHYTQNKNGTGQPGLESGINIHNKLSEDVKQNIRSRRDARAATKKARLAKRPELHRQRQQMIAQQRQQMQQKQMQQQIMQMAGNDPNIALGLMAQMQQGQQQQANDRRGEMGLMMQMKQMQNNQQNAIADRGLRQQEMESTIATNNAKSRAYSEESRDRSFYQQMLSEMDPNDPRQPAIAKAAGLDAFTQPIGPRVVRDPSTQAPTEESLDAIIESAVRDLGLSGEDLLKQLEQQGISRDRAELYADANQQSLAEAIGLNFRFLFGMDDDKLDKQIEREQRPIRTLYDALEMEY